jgi:hypothetical protein
LGGVPCASAEKLTLAVKQTAPARTPVKYPAYLGIGSSSIRKAGNC